MLEVGNSDEMLKLISVIYRKTQMYLNERNEALGLTSGQIPFLMRICEKGKMPQNRFCELLDMDKSTVAKMIARLEKDGYVTRKCNEEDSRSFDVYPTEKAKSVYPILYSNGKACVDEITKDMTEVERAIYFQLMQKAAKNAVDAVET